MKNFVVSIILGFVLIIIGSGIFAVEISDYEYIDDLPDDVEKTTDSYVYSLDKKIFFNNKGDFNIFVDNEVEEGSILVEVSYYDAGSSLKVSDYSSGSNRHLNFYLAGNINSPKYFYNFLLDSLKENKMYNLEKFGDVDVTVYVNEKDQQRFDDYITSGSRFYIRDETEMCAEMLEELYKDNDYVYYLPCLQSETIFVIYSDGYKESVRSALNRKNVTIDELLDKGLEVIIYDVEK